MSAGSRKGVLVFGLILIAIGLVFLLANWIPNISPGQLIVRYWPLLPMLIGIRKLYGYAAWKEDAAAPEAPAGRSLRRRPSLLGGLLWLALGVLFLLRNLGIGPDLWVLAGRYWPILLILLGLGKVVDYYRQKEGISAKFGEVFGLLLVFIIGLAISRIPNSALRDIFMSPIHIGGADVNLGTSYGYTQESSYPLSPGLMVRVENTNGQVSVTPGIDGEIRVRLRKVVFENEEVRAKEIAGEIQILGGEEGKAEATAFVLRTNRDELSAKGYRFNTDMDIFVPKQVRLEINNSFGGVNVSNLDCQLKAQTSHQPLEVHDCSGGFILENRYGVSRLSNLTGNLSVVARRGRVTVDEVKGNVEVREDGSPVVVSNVEGTLLVQNTDGGSIVVDHITQLVTIEAPGTQVTVSNLEDGVRISSSHRRVEVTDVKAGVVLSSGYATAVLKKIQGNVDIKSNSDRITLEEIGGYIIASAQGSSVRANSVAGPVEITTTLKDVVVKDFSKGCRVTNENGDVTLSALPLGKEDITVKNRNGDITLFLPPDAAFQMEATARNGRISSDFRGLEVAPEESESPTLKSAVKTGGPKITLETDYSDIRIRTREVESAATRNR
ncbi:MAG: hypothetical protein H6Q05_452 [Acidobacteria bacterium]|nr:hypothetical protein [Acidobacteriota bacterium]